MKYSFEDLKGKNCVITGGFGVIGMALTRGLAESGAGEKTSRYPGFGAGLQRLRHRPS